MGYVFTRKQLYELVWTGPITTLAKTLLISDVGLAKACRRGDIPLPPRGYWAKLTAGKCVARPLLPLRAPGASDRVEVGSGQPRLFRPDNTDGNDDGVERDDPPPEPPVYDEALDAVEARIRHALPAKFKFARGLDNAHPQIARLLREDDERREAMTKTRYAFDKPRFESYFEQRRLAFLSNLFLLLARVDVQGLVRGREARELSAHVGDQHVKLKVETLASLRPRKSHAHEKKNEPMAIEVEVARWQHGEREERLFWSDGEDGKLENRLQEISIAIVLVGERQYRKARQFSYEWDRRSFEEKIERARTAREEAERQQQEARQQAEKDAISSLLSKVSAHHQAQQIRAYVVATTTSPHAVQGRAFDGEREAWARWALAVADHLDPLALALPVDSGGRAGSLESDNPEHQTHASDGSAPNECECHSSNRADTDRTKTDSRNR
ncbi:hypothetical protein SBC1_02890 [Caballeronia sp. SBC1]|uniref:hypothetical protein n=1 Tax=Caballeronia sp. SBC1 TaxID=2705548 RepID=UPI00140CBB8D|nr:hypothetical protein [Caballeronia sp. SBC1]QIN60314.1 hypothetical protein SBC1_02890 [Caballeronia sp. SBC1]